MDFPGKTKTFEYLYNISTHKSEDIQDYEELEYEEHCLDETLPLYYQGDMYSIIEYL